MKILNWFYPWLLVGLLISPLGAEGEKPRQSKKLEELGQGAERVRMASDFFAGKYAKVLKDAKLAKYKPGSESHDV